ncbi:hypothetical protein DIPPA_25565 [Diplonema papillatum]|nr:hypothetical protein DIPPA_25565 [Diplonema papillatum]
MAVAAMLAAGFLVLAEPPREMPAELADRYTMHGKAKTARFYVDDTGDGEGTHYNYPESSINDFIAAAERVKAKGVDVATENKRLWLFEALRLHPLEAGAKVAVYGSIEPWYEAIAVAHGAGSVVTIEYNNYTLNHDKMKTVTVAACAADPEPAECRDFDAAFSMSSFDHDGLGRYGDPLDPDGDLRAMKTALSQLKPGGILFLTVPVGPDVVVWNLHRRYGYSRLKLLLAGWDVLARVAWDKKKLFAAADYKNSYEPVFVLRRPLPGTEPTDFTKKKKKGKKATKPRLKLLLAGWDVLARVAWDKKKLFAAADYKNSYEPVFVLRRPLPGTEPTDFTKKKKKGKKATKPRLKLFLAGWDVLARVAWDEKKLFATTDYKNSYEPVFVLRRPLPGTEPTDSTKKKKKGKKATKPSETPAGDKPEEEL